MVATSSLPEGTATEEGSASLSDLVGEVDRLVKMGSFGEASDLAAAMVAEAFGPKIYECALAAFVAADNMEGARELVRRIPALNVRTPQELRVFSAEAGIQNNVKLAIFLGLAAVALEPDNADFHIHLGSLLCQVGALAFSESTLKKAIRLDEGRSDVHRVLSAVLAIRRMRTEAIKEIERAIELRSDIVDYRLHAAGLYVDAELPHEAIYHLTCGLSIDKENDLLWRLMSAAYLQVGKIRFSIEAASRAASFSPTHVEYKDNLILNYGAESSPASVNAQFGPSNADFEFVPGLFQKRSGLTAWRNAWQVQCRVIWALMLRETRTIYGSSKFGYLWAIFEPLSHLGLLYAVFIIMGHSAVPPIGDNMLVFYFSGLLPYLCFAHGSEKAMHVIASNVSILGFPQISVADVVLGRTLLSFTTDLFVLFLVFGIFAAINFLPSPGSVLDMVGSYLALMGLTTGVAFLNSIISSYVDAWEKIWPTFLRVQYFTCGLFYHPSGMPEWIRNILSYNPIFHVLEWFREGFFHSYHSEFLDIPYLLTVCIVTLAVGLCVEAVAGSHLKGHS